MTPSRTPFRHLSSTKFTYSLKPRAHSTRNSRSYIVKDANMYVSIRYLGWGHLPSTSRTNLSSFVFSQNFKPPAPPGAQQTSSPAPPSGTATPTPMPHMAMGRGTFINQQQFGGTGGGRYPLNAVATPPFFPMPGPNQNYNINQNWRNR